MRTEESILERVNLDPLHRTLIIQVAFEESEENEHIEWLSLFCRIFLFARLKFSS